MHAHHATSYGLLAALATFHPLVVTSHGSDILISGQRRTSRWLVARVLRAADLVTAPGDHVAEEIRRLGGARRVVVFQYGIDVRRLREVATSRADRAKRSAQARLVTARPLHPLYHTDEIIRAVALLSDAGFPGHSTSPTAARNGRSWSGWRMSSASTTALSSTATCRRTMPSD